VATFTILLCFYERGYKPSLFIKCGGLFDRVSEYYIPMKNSADPSGRLVAGIAGTNPAWGMDVCLLCLYVVLSCVGRGFCDGLITRPEESYRVSNCMRDHRNPERGPTFQLVPTGK
jgi:hypothetical protein